MYSPQLSSLSLEEYDEIYQTINGREWDLFALGEALMYKGDDSGPLPDMPKCLTASALREVSIFFQTYLIGNLKCAAGNDDRKGGACIKLKHMSYQAMGVDHSQKETCCWSNL